MKTLAYIFAVLALGAGCKSIPEQFAGKKTDAFRDTTVCMVYNVENLFDLADDGSEYPEYKPGQCNWNAETLDRKLQNISGAIAAADADIVALVEIENSHALKLLQQALGRKGRPYTYSALADTPNPTSTSPAVLSRLPIKNWRSHGVAKIDSNYTRNILEADIAMGTAGLKLFICHWPSKNAPESRRIAAAEALAKRLSELAAGTDYVIAGDLNSNYNECSSFSRTRLNDTEGRTGINHVLATVVSSPDEPIDYIYEKELVARSGSQYHYNLWLELPLNKRLSYMHGKKPETIDNFLVPASMYDSQGISYVDNSFQVFRWSGRLIFDGKPYRWQYRWSKKGRIHVGEGYSDHLPLLMKVAVCGEKNL